MPTKLDAKISKDIVFSALKQLGITGAKKLNTELGQVLPKIVDRKSFRTHASELLGDLDFTIEHEAIPIDPEAKIRHVIEAIRLSALPGKSTAPEPDKPVPGMPPRPGSTKSGARKRSAILPGTATTLESDKPVPGMPKRGATITSGTGKAKPQKSSTARSE
jgi:hypothetical protein